MDLSNHLISKFVKATSEQSNNKTKEGTAFGTIVEFENKMYVKLDGSDLLTPINSTSDVKNGERVTIMIKDHNAVVTGNITSPSASSGDVKRVAQDVTALGGEISEFGNIVANKVGVSELDAEVARINELIAGRATIEDLTATNAEITNLKAKDAEIANLVAGKAEIGELTATNAEIKNLKAENAEITSLVAGKANISDLTAINADITNLKAKDAEIANLVAGKAEIGELKAANANINILDAEVASIQTLVNGNLTSDNIASLNLTSANTTIQNAMIKDAMIDSVMASKIKSGTIDTNLVTIQSTDGSMILTGSVQQFKDENGVTRIQIGKDTGGNFTFILYDENGTGVLIDEDGIKSSNAIADGLIVDAKVADNANISGAKLDIASVITEVNNDNSTTIKSNKIYLDEQGQSLEVAFNSLKTQVETIQDVTIDGDLTSIVEQVQSNTTQIEANKEGINTLVAENVIKTEKISNLEGELQQVNTTLSSKYTSLEQNINGFKTTVGETYTTKSEFDNLEVGGRNLATLSNIQDYTGGNLSNNKYYSVEGTKIIAKNQPLNSSLIGFKVYTDNTFEYVASGYTDTSQVQVFFRCYDKNNVMIQDQKQYPKAVVDGKFILSFNDIPKDTYYFHMGIGNIFAANYFIDKLKIEKGNKATDYTPAPEDVQSNIDAVDGKFANYSTTSQMNSAIQQKANEITSSVSQTYVTNYEAKKLADTTTTGLNKYLFERYKRDGFNYASHPTMNDLVGARLIESKLVDSPPVHTSSLDDSYLGVLTFYLYYDHAWTQTTTVTTDDAGRVYLNNVDIYDLTSCKQANVTFNFIKGLNKIEIIYAENSGADGVSFGGVSGWSAFGAYANVVTNEIANRNNELTLATAQGNMLYTDPTFRTGMNGTHVYNNIANSTTVKLERIAAIDGCPNTSGYCLKITTSGEAKPGLGGFYFGNMSRPNAVFITKITAKIPVGYSIAFASNAVGNNSEQKWLSSTSGTGEWRDYYHKVKCGNTGTFSSTNFYHLRGTAATAANPVTWHVSYATVFDATDSDERITDLTNNLATYATKSELTQTNNSITASFSESGGYNLIRNSTGACGTASGWTHSATSIGTGFSTNVTCPRGYYLYIDNGTTTTERYAYSSRFRLKPNTQYRFTGYFNCYDKCPNFDVYVLGSTVDETDTTITYTATAVYHIIKNQHTNGEWKKFTAAFTTGNDVRSGIIRIDANGYNSSGVQTNKIHWSCLSLTEGPLEVPWSPHPSEVYDGITTIDKNGIKVAQSNYNGYTQMRADGFYVNNGSENVISITKDGSYFKGKVVITSGSTVPTSVLSGTISSNQLNSSITSDISTAKSNASTAVSTANTANTNASTAVSTANTAVSTANTANTNASTAVSTANTAKSTADTAKSTVDSGKTNWNNAYNRVNEWAYGAVTGSTTIDGAYIQANTIAADKIAVADFTNYANLNADTLSKWGWSSVADSSASSNPWFQRTSVNRDNQISKWYSCNGGETFRIKADIFSSVYGQASNGGTATATARGVCIMIFTINADGSREYFATTRVTAASTSGTKGTVNSVVTISANARLFAVYVNIGGYPSFSGVLRVRNVLVNKMSSGELIVDGSITANKIAADAITGKTIKGGSISGSTITGNTITGGTISGTSISGTKFTSAGTDGNSGQYQTMTLNSGALMMTGAIAGGTNDGQEAYRTYLTSMGLIVKDSSNGGFGGNANALYTNTGIFWNPKKTGGEEYPGWQQLIGYYNDYVLIDRLPLRVSNKIYNPGICTNYTNFYVSPASNGEVKIVTYDSDWGAANDQMTFRPIRASAFYRSDGKSAYINGSGNANLANASALVANGVKADSTDFFVGVNGRVRVTNTAGYNSGNGLTYKPIMASAFENGSDLMFKKNIRTTDDLDVIDILNKVDVYRYDMIGGNENEIGLIAQVCPSDLISGTPYNMDIQMANEITDEDRQALVDPDNGGASVNLYHMASILWKVCKEQQKRIERLEKSMKGEE